MRFFIGILFLASSSLLSTSCSNEPGVSPIEPYKPFNHIIDVEHEHWKAIYEYDQHGALEEYIGDAQLLGYDQDRVAFHISAETLVTNKKFNYTNSISMNGSYLKEYKYPIDKEVGRELHTPMHRFNFQAREEDEIIYVQQNVIAERISPSNKIRVPNMPIIYSIDVNATPIHRKYENYTVNRNLDFTAFNVTGERDTENRPSIFVQVGSLMGDTVVLYGDDQLKKVDDGESYLDEYYDPSCAFFSEDLGWIYFVFYEDCYMCETESLWKLGVFTLEDKQVIKGYEDDNISLEGIMTAILIEEFDLDGIDDHHDSYYWPNFSTARVKKVNENELLLLFHLGAYYSMFRYYIDSQSLTPEFENLLLPEYAGPNYVDFTNYGALCFGDYHRLYSYYNGRISVLYEKGHSFDSQATLMDFLVTDEQVIGMFHQEYTVENAKLKGSISKTFSIAIGSCSLY